jgi:hypothetical protein
LEHEAKGSVCNDGILNMYGEKCEHFDEEEGDVPGANK